MSLTLQQFLEVRARKPGSIDMASGGARHGAASRDRAAAGRAKVKLRHVPYRGGAPALQDLLAGQVAALFGTAGLLAGYVKAGKLRALGRRRPAARALLPDVPTIQEAGLADFRAVSWDGLFAPKAHSGADARPHACCRSGGTRGAGSQAAMGGAGARVELESRADFARFVGEDIQRWSAVIKAAGIQME